MCFSLGISVTTAAILIPAGLLCLKNAARLSQPYWAFALLPLAFGIQQLFEGGVWWALETGDADALRLSTLGFLFFSHFFWLSWVPAACYLTETEKKRRTLFLLITVVGTLSGATMFVPFVLHAEWLEVSVVNHSIVYSTTLLHDDYLSQLAGTIVYILIIILPLILSSDRHIRTLGALILLSMIVTMSFFNFAFISVWCYFAAVISLYIYYSIIIKNRSARHQT